MCLRVNALSLATHVLRAGQAWVRAILPRSDRVVRVALRVEVVVASDGMRRPAGLLADQMGAPVGVQLGTREHGPVHARDAAGVMTLEHLHALLVAEEVLSVLTPLGLGLLHVLMLLEALRRQHQAVVVIQLDERVVHIPRLLVVQGALAGLAARVHEGIRQVRHVDATMLLHGPDHPRLVREAHRWPHVAVRRHLANKPVAVGLRLSVLIPCVGAAQEAVEAHRRVGAPALP
mmetsp:Transcript_25529/g.76787  ORF Transcript_25529/g.76787 Transcript_25529/m.76787 type:complete len:233 (+) Transcript_25529:363-1061(+)